VNMDADFFFSNAVRDPLTAGANCTKIFGGPPVPQVAAGTQYGASIPDDAIYGASIPDDAIYGASIPDDAIYGASIPDDAIIGSSIPPRAAGPENGVQLAAAFAPRERPYTPPPEPKVGPGGGDMRWRYMKQGTNIVASGLEPGEQCNAGPAPVDTYPVNPIGKTPEEYAAWDTTTDTMILQEFYRRGLLGKDVAWGPSEIGSEIIETEEGYSTGGLTSPMPHASAKITSQFDPKWFSAGPAPAPSPPYPQTEERYTLPGIDSDGWDPSVSVENDWVEEALSTPSLLQLLFDVGLVRDPVSPSREELESALRVDTVGFMQVTTLSPKP
jgi:hypothetical protein